MTLWYAAACCGDASVGKLCPGSEPNCGRYCVKSARVEAAGWLAVGEVCGGVEGKPASRADAAKCSAKPSLGAESDAQLVDHGDGKPSESINGPVRSGDLGLPTILVLSWPPAW